MNCLDSGESSYDEELRLWTVELHGGLILCHSQQYHEAHER
jgi:hypothetical protein